MIHDIAAPCARTVGAPVPDLVRELVIAHTKPGLHKVYDQHAYESEKRHALELWAARLRQHRRTTGRQRRAAGGARLTLAVGDAMVRFGRSRGANAFGKNPAQGS